MFIASHFFNQIYQAEFCNFVRSVWSFHLSAHFEASSSNKENITKLFNAFRCRRSKAENRSKRALGDIFMPARPARLHIGCTCHLFHVYSGLKHANHCEAPQFCWKPFEPDKGSINSALKKPYPSMDKAWKPFKTVNYFLSAMVGIKHVFFHAYIEL